jgi:hypothetical protein
MRFQKFVTLEGPEKVIVKVTGRVKVAPVVVTTKFNVAPVDPYQWEVPSVLTMKQPPAGVGVVKGATVVEVVVLVEGAGGGAVVVVVVVVLVVGGRVVVVVVLVVGGRVVVVVVLVVGGCVVELVVMGWAVGAGEGVVVVVEVGAGAEKVEPIVPHLMFENTTYAPGY